MEQALCITTVEKKQEPAGWYRLDQFVKLRRIYLIFCRFIGGQETDIVVTVLRPNGDLLYFVQVAPTNQFSQYQSTFRNVMNSVSLR